MWKLLCQFSVVYCLAACQKELEIAPADDLNTFYKDTNWRIFTVKIGLFQKAECRDLEYWAKHHLSQYNNKEYKFYFLEYDDDLTFKGNRYLKSEYDIMLFEYNLCMMYSDDKQCSYCWNEK